jgi:hypothetical protein
MPMRRQATARWTLGLMGVAVLGAACSSNSTSGPDLSGDWHGYVALHDEYGVPLATNAGVTVASYNGSSAGPSGTSAGDGSFTLSSLHTGVYTLSYSSASIGTFLRPQIAFVGGGTQFLGLQNLSNISTGVVTNLLATPSASGDTLVVTGTQPAPPVGYSRLVRLFYGTAATVSSSPALYTVTAEYKTTKFPFTIAVTATDLAAIRAAFGVGSTAYVVAYGDSFYPNSYVDTTSGNTVFPNVSPPSNVVTFVVP